MKVIAVVSAKGGVGKTTISANLAAALRKMGRDMVVVDMDPQNAVALHLNLSGHARRGAAEAILTGIPAQDVVMRSEGGVRVIPFGTVTEARRDALERRLHDEKDLLHRFLRGLDLPPDSIVIVDTPPGPSAYLRQVLPLARLPLVVALADAASYATLPAIHRLIQTYCRKKANFIEYHLILNQVNRARQLNKDIVRVVQAQFGERLVGLIHHDQAVADSLASLQNVLIHAPHSQASLEFEQCAERIAALIEKPR